VTSPSPWFPALSDALPTDADRAVLIGRVWDPAVSGPTPVLIHKGRVRALTPVFATVRDLLEEPDPVAAARAAIGDDLGSAADIYANTPFDVRDDSRSWLLAPHDLQAVKAAGVTFAVSMIERVIEEQARGDATAAAALRETITAHIGGDLRGLVPGSDQAMKLKDMLIGEGLWSQYLEVGIGPDAEIFTKALPLSSRGTGEQIGVLASSTWNNPEPEVALVVTSSGTVVGATLGNDVNLRDVEGRSALLLPKAKDNNAACATGPFIRLFDDAFTIDDVRGMAVTVEVRGTDGFTMRAESDMRQISRDPLDLVGQLIGPHHQYPDGAILMLGTLFAPIEDRDAEGMGFTHKLDDVVTIASRELGALVNVVQHSETCDEWTFGMGALMRNLASRDLL